MRGALAALLDLETDLAVVRTVDRGDLVLTAALADRPDIAVLDIEMPGLDGISAAGQLRDGLPTCKVVIVTTFGRPGYLRRALEAGARAFLVKDSPVEDLARAIRRVVAGEQVVDPSLAVAALREGPNPLSDREIEVLRAAKDGAKVSDIAGGLYLSESTVRNYLSATIGKTGTRNRIEAARVAAERGWI